MAAPFNILLRGTLVWRLRREGDGGGAHAAVPPPFLLGLREVQMTMTEGSYSLSEESMRVAEEGIRGMINATSGATVKSFVMIGAASHILAAWVASSQIRSSAQPAERHADVEELEELLPSFIEYHRTAQWLPNPHRIDN